jgi:hypothetical protein
MAKYKVVRPIEHNHTLYLPGGEATTGKAKSSSHGDAIAVDNSGIIELTAQEAAQFTGGQIEPLAKEGTHSTPAGTTHSGQPGGPDFMPTPIKQ